MAVTSIVTVARRLRDAVDALEFAAPVTHVYNPLAYAWQPHRRYLERYGKGRKDVLLLGMNPGPFGMAQTGIPFGDVAVVRDWLGIDGRVTRPDDEHPKRQVLGFQCTRREVSGSRLWGWASERFADADRFAERFFVWNYCPLSFMESSGRNRTPDKLPAAERENLYAICDAALAEVVRLVSPRHLVGVGRFARMRAEHALEPGRFEFVTAPHPSPASPLANRGWAPLFDAALAEAGIAVP